MEGRAEGSRRHVVVAGAGVAGLETALALRALAGRLVSVELVAPEEEFVYRPFAVAEPFGAGEARRAPLGALAREAGASLRRGRLVGVDAERRVALLGHGVEIPYDSLVVAVGARAREAVAGAITFRAAEDRSDVAAVAGLLDRAATGDLRRIVFALPAQVTWPLPLYELALLTASRLATRGAGGVELALVTPETRPLAIFGPRASDAVVGLLEDAGVRIESASLARAWEDGVLKLAGGRVLDADAVVALPRLEVPPLAGLPQDGSGFVASDGLGRVADLADVYAAGDVTQLPLKQDGIAAQQADAVASAIAGEAGSGVAPASFEPVLRGLLLTGAVPRFLRAEKGASLVDAHPLWWPPAKIVGRHLSPFLGRALALEPESHEPPNVEAIAIDISLETRDAAVWSTV